MSHDYQPEWDYDVIELSDIASLSAKDRENIEKIVSDTTNVLGKAFEFQESCEVFYFQTKDADDPISVFANGTSSRPVLGLNIELIKSICDHEDLGFLHQVEISLVNVMAHAYMETISEDSGPSREARISAAEEFARDWADYRCTDLPLLHRAAYRSEGERA